MRTRETIVLSRNVRRGFNGPLAPFSSSRGGGDRQKSRNPAYCRNPNSKPHGQHRRGTFRPPDGTEAPRTPLLLGWVMAALRLAQQHHGKGSTVPVARAALTSSLACPLHPFLAFDDIVVLHRHATRLCSCIRISEAASWASYPLARSPQRRIVFIAVIKSIFNTEYIFEATGSSTWKNRSLPSPGSIFCGEQTVHAPAPRR